MENKGKNSENTVFDREQRRSTVKKQSQLVRFNKVIVPYSFDEGAYTVNEEDVEILDDAEYILSKLNQFKESGEFNLEKDLKMSCFSKMLYTLKIALLALILIWGGLFVILLFSFNPVIITIIGMISTKLGNFLRIKIRSNRNKNKLDQIKKILAEESKNRECVERGLSWNMGQSGFWIEVIKVD